MPEIFGFLKIVGEIQHLVRKRSQKINYDFTSYLSIVLSKILPHSKTIKNAKNFSVFDENESRHLSQFLESHIFSNFDHIFRIYNQSNYRNIWFPKVIIILIMTVLFFNVFFSEKDPHLIDVGAPLRRTILFVYFNNALQKSQSVSYISINNNFWFPTVRKGVIT